MCQSINNDIKIEGNVIPVKTLNIRYFVYMIISISKNYKKSYVGYTNNLTERLKKHNSNKGAKSTKGYKWKIIFKKKFLSKSNAMRYEYKLKKDRKKRLIIIKNSKKFKSC